MGEEWGSNLRFGECSPKAYRLAEFNSGYYHDASLALGPVHFLVVWHPPQQETKNMFVLVTVVCLAELEVICVFFS